MCVYIGEGRMRKERKVNKMKGRISRIGSYAIASSVKDHPQQPCITCTTFNILAPIYKRLNHEVPFCHSHTWSEFSLFDFFFQSLFLGSSSFVLNVCFYDLFDSFFLFFVLFFVGGGNRIRVAVKVIIEHIGWPGIIAYWIGCCMRDLPSFVFRFAFA
jgi:hypothetical protein